MPPIPTRASPVPATSIIVPFATGQPQDLVPLAVLVRDTPARRLWYGQTVDWDAHLGVAHLAGAGHRVPVGNAVALTATRHPCEAAIQARTLAAMTGHDVVLGMGPGTDDLVQGLRGDRYRSPLTAVRDYLTILRDLLEGRTCAYTGEYFSMHGGLPEREHPPVALGLGVLRPGAARLAGAVADVAITWMTPPHYVQEVLAPALRRGAQEAGRATPRIATVVHVALDRDGRDPYRMAWCAAHRHLSLPNYSGMLRRAGLTVHHSSPAIGAKALVDSGTFLTGSPADVVRGLGAYADAGVDEVILNAAGVHSAEGPAAAVRDLRQIVDALPAGAISSVM
ncbi:LLM class flavin-dependent oxidoreductase [Pseudonocardia saturnea]